MKKKQLLTSFLEWLSEYKTQENLSFSQIIEEYFIRMRRRRALHKAIRKFKKRKDAK